MDHKEGSRPPNLAKPHHESDENKGRVVIHHIDPTELGDIDDLSQFDFDSIIVEEPDEAHEELNRTPLQADSATPDNRNQDTTTNRESELNRSDYTSRGADTTRIKQLESEIQTARERLARATAELKSFQRRTEKLTKNSVLHANAQLLQGLLPCLDNLERALNVPKSNTNSTQMREGLKLVFETLVQTLAQFGLRPFNSEGESFDPRYHEAVEVIDHSEVPADTVVNELQRGYFHLDRLLRPARVRVTRKTAALSTRSPVVDDEEPATTQDSPDDSP